jgi:imidazolonepropionase-like amidohydrolase
MTRKELIVYSLKMTFRASLTAVFAAVVLLCGAIYSSLQGQTPEQTIIFRNVTVFDGSRMIPRTNVIVRDGIIKSVGQRLAVPPSAQVIDGAGKTLLPGLFDAHTHLGLTFGEQFLRDALDFGITTELEMWGSDASLALRKKLATGAAMDVADLRTAGTGVTVPQGHPTQMGGPPFPTLGPSDDVQVFVDARIAEGADYIKIIYDHAFPTLTKQQLADIVAAAHRRNKLVVVHATTQSDARDAIAAGADGLAHIFADSPPDPDFARFAAAHHVFVVPTLSVLEAITDKSGTPWWQGVPQVSGHITPSMRRSLEMKFPASYGAKLKFLEARAAVVALHQAGVPILAGTDAPAPGLAHGVSIHRELELLVNSGLTPLDALESATSIPARIFGLNDRGRIAPGFRADLLLVNGNPRVDIRATRDIAGIWKLGVPHVRSTSGDQ